MFRNRSTDVFESIQNITTNFISDSMQRAGAEAFFDQSFNLDCRGFDSGSYYVDCLNSFKDFPDEERESICDTWRGFTCSAHSIVMEQAVNMNVTAEQQNAVKLLVENELESNLEADIRRDTSLITLGDTVRTEISNYADVVNDIVSSNLADIYSSFGARQVIDGFNGSIEFVTMKQAIDYVGDYLQRNGAYNEALQRLSQSINAEIRQQDKTLNMAIAVSVGILSALLLLLMVVFIMRKVRQKRG